MTLHAEAPAAMPAKTGAARPAAGDPVAGVKQVRVARFEKGLWQSTLDQVAEECPVALEYNAVAHATMLATPCDLEDFAVGFSLTEGIVSHAADLGDVWPEARDEGIILHVEIPETCEAVLQERRRLMSGRSGCGLCGLESLSQIYRPVPVRPRRLRSLSLAALERAARALPEAQRLHRLTGAVHAAAWATPDGSLVRVREDVGRHNALDKLGGSLVRDGTGLGDGFLVMSSRASYEIVLKAAVLGIEVVAAISAPTGFAVQLAEQSGITLIGFTRGSSCVVYTHPDRMQA